MSTTKSTDLSPRFEIGQSAAQTRRGFSGIHAVLASSGGAEEVHATKPFRVVSTDRTLSVSSFPGDCCIGKSKTTSRLILLQRLFLLPSFRLYHSLCLYHGRQISQTATDRATFGQDVDQVFVATDTKVSSRFNLSRIQAHYCGRCTVMEKDVRWRSDSPI